MPTITPVIKVTFQLGNAPKDIKVEDITNYAGTPAIDTDSAKGLLKITGPAGILYQNTGYATDDFSTPDITFPGGVADGIANLPLDVSNKVQTGDYTFEYKVQVLLSAVPEQQDTVVDVLAYSHTTPVVVIGQTADCICSELTSVDNTSYGLDVVTLTRTHTVTPPVGSGLNPTVSSNATVVATPIATNTWTTTISSVVEYLESGLYITETVAGSREIKVECASTLCDIYCCINTLYNRWKALVCNNSSRAKEVEETQLEPVLRLAFLHGEAIKCGRNDDAAAFFTDILLIADCSQGCGCGSDEPQLITPLCIGGGASSITIVDACGNGAITVTSNTIGDTTTYTVCFDDDRLNKLDDLTETLVTGDASISVTTVDTGDYDREFQLAFIGSTGTTNNTLSFILEIDYETALSSGTTIAPLTQSAITATGAVLNATADVDWLIQSDFASWLSSGAALKVSNFGSSTGFKPIVSALEVVSFTALGNTVFAGVNDPLPFDAHVYNISTDQFIIFLGNHFQETGLPATNVNYYDKITKLQLQITLIA